VKINGPKQAIRNKIGLVLPGNDEYGLVSTMSIEENICLSVSNNIHKKRVLLNKYGVFVINELNMVFNIDIRNNNCNVTALSFGEQRKVLLGEWLAINPKVLILYEVTSRLDEINTWEIWNLLNDLAMKGISLILMSRNISELVALSNRVVIMRDGEIYKILQGGEVNSEIITKEVFS
jgi:ABC-type sugar transport system ATPase subunit